MRSPEARLKRKTPNITLGIYSSISIRRASKVAAYQDTSSERITAGKSRQKNTDLLST